MVRLIYASTVVDAFDPAEIDDILRAARARNVRENMTGFLFFTTDYFVQCLEGERRAVNRLYADLLRDPRHHDLVILDCAEIRERMFTAWKMAYIGPGDLSENFMQPFLGETGFDPYSLDRVAANELMLLLSKQLKEIQA